MAWTGRWTVLSAVRLRGRRHGTLRRSWRHNRCTRLTLDPSYITRDEGMGTAVAIAWVFSCNPMQALNDLRILHPA